MSSSREELLQDACFCRMFVLAMCCTWHDLHLFGVYDGTIVPSLTNSWLMLRKGKIWIKCCKLILWADRLNHNQHSFSSSDSTGSFSGRAWTMWSSWRTTWPEPFVFSQIEYDMRSQPIKGGCGRIWVESVAKRSKGWFRGFREGLRQILKSSNTGCGTILRECSKESSG